MFVFIIVFCVLISKQVMVFHGLEIKFNSRLLYVNMAYSECKVCSKCYLGIIDYSDLDTGICYCFKSSCSLSFMFSLLPVLTICSYV